MRLLLVLCVLMTVAHAQPVAAIGKPLPSSDLAAGTIVVRVIDGTVAAPHPNVAVTLIGDKKPRTATTDAAGRATFDHVTLGASVQTRVKSTSEPLATSDTFVVPDDGGIRVMLSFTPMKMAADSVGAPRTTSGVVIPDDGLAAGTLDVRLTYDDLADRNPPSGVVVTLVGYAADDAVKVTTETTAVSGIARFTNLDHSGAIAYYAMAQLPRNDGADRLLSRPVVLGAHGASIVLSAEQRTAKLPAIDEVITLEGRTATPTKKGAVRIALDGVNDPNTPVRVIDAATGKAIASATVADKELVVDVAARAGQVLYVEASSHDRVYRSLPFETVTDRGAQVAVYIFPRVLAEYRFAVTAFDDSIEVNAKISIQNLAWIPYREAGDIVVPLPKGARTIDSDVGTVRNASIVLAEPIPPGGREIAVGFELPASAGKAEWSLDLPYGAYKSELYVEKEPGVDLVAPSSVTVATAELNGRTWVGASELSIKPKQAMVLTIKVPPPPKDAVVQHACAARSGRIVAIRCSASGFRTPSSRSSTARRCGCRACAAARWSST